MKTTIFQQMSILTPSVYCYNLALLVTQSAFAAPKRKSRESKITRCSHSNSTTLLLPVWAKATETYDLESTPGRHTLTKFHVCMHYFSLAPANFFKTFFPQNTAMLLLWHNPHSQNVKKTLFSRQLEMYFAVSRWYSALDCPLLSSNKTASTAIT